MLKQPCPFSRFETFTQEWNIPRRAFSSLPEVRNLIDEMVWPLLQQAATDGRLPKPYRRRHICNPQCAADPAGTGHPLHALMFRVRETIFDRANDKAIDSQLPRLTGEAARTFAVAAAQCWCDPDGFDKRLESARRRRNLAPLPEPQQDCEVPLHHVRDARQLCVEGFPAMLPPLTMIAARALDRDAQFEGKGAADIAHDALLSLLKPSRRAKPVTNWGGYCSTTVRNTVTNLRKDSRKLTNSDTLEERPDPSADVEEAFSKRELVTMVRAGASKLTPAQLRLFRLTLSGCNDAEVAERLDKTPDYVKQTLRDVLKTLNVVSSK